MSSTISQSPASGEPFQLGPWLVQPSRNVIIRGDEERHLENRLMQTLVFLVKNRGQTVSRKQFFDAVWHGLVVNEEALSRAISLLRTALEDSAHTPRYIQTIPGVGYRLIAEVVVGTGQQPATPPGAGYHKNSIAVLPFVNLSDDPANEYFSDGISEEILNVLAQGASFNVVGRTSSFMFKDRNQDLREIGRTLDVAHVLEGSVRKAGARVRITAQLIKTSDGFHLWSETFDRELDDIFAVQDEIASAVLEALKVRLLGRADEHRVVGGTEDTKAYQAYLMGLHYRNRGALLDTVQRAIGAFEQAIELDPDYARAWAGLAHSWADMFWNGYVPQEKGLKEIKKAADKAVELAPNLAGGYLALGMYYQLGFPDWTAALKALTKGVQVNPGNALVLLESARVNCNIGRPDISIPAARKAVELDPVSVYTNHVLAHVLYFCRHYEEAIPAFRRVLELDPHYPKPHYFLAMAHHWLGDSETAWEIIQKEPLDWMRNCAAAVILHALGRTEEAERPLKALVDIGAVGNTFIQQADVYAQWGDTENAIRCLETAVEYRDPGFAQLLVDPFLDPIRDDPRFIEIYDRMGFITK